MSAKNKVEYKSKEFKKINNTNKNIIMSSGKGIYLDTLKEVYSFAAGHIAASLSKLLNKKVRIELPKVWTKLPEEQIFLPQKKKGAIVVIGSRFGLEERGIILHLLTQENAKTLLGIVFNRKINKIGEMEESALLEIGNILSGAIVGPIANFIGKKIILEQPRLNISYHPGAIGYALEEQMQAINSCLFPSVKIRVETKAEETFLISLFFPFFDMVGYIWRKLTAKILEECKNKKILVL